MKRYELKFIDGGLGVFKVSVVKDPAIDANLVHFKAEKEETQFFADEEKRVIYSVVMRPNIDIFRRNVNGEPANVFYTAETVEQQQINYFRNNGNSETNINHSSLANAEGIFPFESWIVDDAETDRAVKFGLDVIKGDWVMGHKVDNDELWTEHIKTGKIDGLSIEATNINYELKEDITMSKDDNKSKTFLEKVKTFLFEEEIAEVSKWWNTVTNTTFAIDDVVTRTQKGFDGAPDEEKPINAGEYELKDGRRILTDAQGVIRFIFPAPAAADTADTSDTDEAAEDAVDENMAVHPDETPEEKKAREKKEAKAKKDKEAADKMAADEDETEEEKKAREAKAAEDEAAAAAAEAPETPAADEEDEEDEDEETLESLNAEIVDLKAQIATLKADAVKAATDLETMAAQTPAAAPIKNLPKVEAVEMTSENYSKMTNREKMKYNQDNKSY